MEILLILKILFIGLPVRLLTNLKYFITGTKPPLTAAGLTALCPIINDVNEGGDGQQSYAIRTRQHLQDLPLHENSPMAKVPNTYLCRFYVLNDVFYEGAPAQEEHLKSKYLVFSSNYYGDLDAYLTGVWEHAKDDVIAIWQHCVDFDKVKNATDSAEFISYIKRCQVTNHLFFNGSTGDPLAEQLKSLYLKQEFTRFVYENQGKKPKDLQKAFQEFISRTQPENLDAPTWIAGAEQETVKS